MLFLYTKVQLMQGLRATQGKLSLFKCLWFIEEVIIETDNYEGKEDRWWLTFEEVKIVMFNIKK